MAQITSARRTAIALRSTVTLKAAVAVSGLTMMVYLLAHMYGNLKVFSGQAAFDGYAHHLRTIGEPFLPHAGALWIIRVVLLASVMVHIYAAITLWHRARGVTAGRGGWRYESRKGRGGVQRTYSSFTLRWGGVVIALFIVYHLLHLTANTIHPGGASQRPYERVVNGFGLWWGVELHHRPACAGISHSTRLLERTCGPRHEHQCGPAPTPEHRRHCHRDRDHLGVPDAAVRDLLRLGSMMTDTTSEVGAQGREA